MHYHNTLCEKNIYSEPGKGGGGNGDVDGYREGDGAGKGREKGQGRGGGGVQAITVMPTRGPFATARPCKNLWVLGVCTRAVRSKRVLRSWVAWSGALALLSSRRSAYPSVPNDSIYTDKRK